MLDLKEKIENEVHSAYDEYLKLESHIKLYITEMEQAIVSGFLSLGSLYPAPGGWHGVLRL
jgi:hypothetical protein